MAFYPGVFSPAQDYDFPSVQRRVSPISAWGGGMSANTVRFRLGGQMRRATQACSPGYVLRLRTVRSPPILLWLGFPIAASCRTKMNGSPSRGSTCWVNSCVPSSLQYDTNLTSRGVSTDVQPMLVLATLGNWLNFVRHLQETARGVRNSITTMTTLPSQTLQRYMLAKRFSHECPSVSSTRHIICDFMYSLLCTI